MDTLMGMKELYNMVIKAKYPFQIGSRNIEEGEVIAAFDNIQLANIQEIKKLVSAHGGYNDWTYITWENTKEIELVFSQGIFSKTHLTLLSNSKLLTTSDHEVISISQREEIETDENGQFQIKFADKNPHNLFVYNKNTGQRYIDYSNLDPYTNLIVDYIYDYDEGGETIEIGNRLLEGFVSLEARTKTKDDITGKVKTGILYIPKVKIVSALSMRLGENANPVVSTFKAIGYPVGSKGSGKVMDLKFLNSEIDSDI